MISSVLVLMAATATMLCVAATSDLDKSILYLQHEVYASQRNSSAPYTFPVIGWGREEGTFPSNIHVNFVGPPLMQKMRRDITVPDDNGFVGPFIIEALVRAGIAAPTLAPMRDGQLAKAIRAVRRNQDRYLESNVPVFGFWPQRRIPNATIAPNATSPYAYKQYSVNLVPFARLFDDAFDDLIKLLANTTNPIAKDIRDVIELFAIIVNTTVTAFNIPMDSDDTGMVIGIMTQLIEGGGLDDKEGGEMMKKTIPDTVKAWRQDASSSSHRAIITSRGDETSTRWKYVEALQRIVRFSYCPAAADDATRRNSIDPRSYFWARDFLTNRTHMIQEDEHDCIFATWLKDFEEELYSFPPKNKTTGRDEWDAVQQPLMPFNVNNIDPTVGADALYGFLSILLKDFQESGNSTTTTSSSKYGVLSWFQSSRKARRALLTTGKFVAWTVAHQLNNISRPDLETLYYPTTSMVVASSARVVRLLRSFQHNSNKKASSVSSIWPSAEIEQIFSMLASAVENGGIQFLNATRTVAAAGGDKKNSNDHAEEEGCGGFGPVCWNGFLGRADTDALLKPTPHADDRYFQTAAALTALIDAFTLAPSVSSSNTTTASLPPPPTWAPSTPAAVKSLIHDTASWLINATVHHDIVDFSCAFFSGSIHNVHTSPTSYPSNVILSLRDPATFYTCTNGTKNSLGNVMISAYYAVRRGATIPKEEYEGWLQNGCAGQKMANRSTFPGWNSLIQPWPYWSSPVLSKALALRGLADYRALLATQ